eukprot:592508-Amphidinium_carterae.1
MLSLGNWLHEVLVPTPIGVRKTEVDVEKFWSLFGVTGEALEILVESGLWYCRSASRLHVHWEFLSQAEAVARLSGVLVELWRLASYSESRWLSLGTSAKQMLVLLSSGYDDFLRYCRKHNKVSEWDSSGADQLGQDMKEWLVVIGLATGPIDAVLSDVLSDNRLAT